MRKSNRHGTTQREFSTFFDRGLQQIDVGGEAISLRHLIAYFPHYLGPRPKNSWQKPIAGPPTRPFAELQVVERLEQEGWKVAWVYRPGKFIRTWEPRAGVAFPRAAASLLARIQDRAGAKAGCWDVFAWKDGAPRFIEIKRRNSSDRIRESQLRWRRAALSVGVDPAAFELVEWCGGSLKARRLRLSFHFGDEDKGWVEWRHDGLAYSDSHARNNKGILDFYRNRGIASEADLLWLVFRCNSSGLSYCQFDELPVRQSRASRILKT